MTSEQRGPSIIQFLGPIFLGLSIPALFSGSAVFGAFILLSFLCTFLSSSPKEIFNFFKSEKSNKIIALSAITFIAFMFTVLFSVDQTESLKTITRYILEPLLVFYLCYIFRNHTDIILKSLLLGSFFYITVFLFSHYIYNDLFYIIKFKYIHHNRINSAVKSPINAIALFVPIIILYYNINKRIIFKPYIRILFCILIIWTVIISSSKAATLALILSILTIGITYSLFNKNKRIALITLAGITFSIIFSIIWLPKVTYTPNFSPSEFIFLPEWLIDFHRQVIWHFSFNKIFESPFVGFGINASNLIPEAQTTLTEYTNGLVEMETQVLPGHPHNWVLEIFLDTGLIGGIPFMILVGFIFVRNIRSYARTKHPMLLAALGVNAAYWGSGLFNFSYWTAWWQVSYFIALFICLSLYLRDRESQDTYDKN